VKTIHITDRKEWRAWLADHFDRETEIWLVYNKKDTGLPSIEYGASVEEALCFGWVDSLIKKLDDNRYARKFTPRKEISKWSEHNKKRVEKMIKAGRMTAHGIRLVESAKKNRNWDRPDERPSLKFSMHPEFQQALDKNSKAREVFDNLAASHQKQYLGWIEMAKRPETRRRRIEEALQMLAKGEKLGLK
jgi:uncharacterized protein YdeI (YjbR/CyaY-like superfamily)